MINRSEIEAIYKLYPNVVHTLGDEAFDAEGNKVQYDLKAVQEKANSIDVDKQKTYDSAIAKLKKLGLNDDEISALVRAA